MPDKPRRTFRLSLGVLLLGLALGALFDAVLAHELVKRQHRFRIHHPPMQLYNPHEYNPHERNPHEGVAPADPKRSPHHRQRERLLVTHSAVPACEPCVVHA